MGKVTFYTRGGKEVSFQSSPSRRSSSPPPTPAQARARKSFVDRFAYGLGAATAKVKATKPAGKTRLGEDVRTVATAAKQGYSAVSGFTRGFRKSGRNGNGSSPPSPAQLAARKNFVQKFAYGAGRGAAASRHVRENPDSLQRKSRTVRTLSRGIAFGIGAYQGVRDRKNAKAFRNTGEKVRFSNLFKRKEK